MVSACAAGTTWGSQELERRMVGVCPLGTNRAETGVNHDPLGPLRGTVIFPGLTAPIAAGRPGTLRAIEASLRGDRLVFAVAQRDNTDEPSPEILYSMGVIAKIGQVQRGLGGVQLLLQGEERATALQYTQTDNFQDRK